MTRAQSTVVLLTAGMLALPVYAGGGGWVDFTNETSVRMPTPLNDPSISTTDPEEKDYAFADLDQDGDIDLIVVRKQPFTSTGKRVNVLFMNEGTAEGHSINGVLVDRTDDYATASDVGGDQGFNTPTNDRDVVIVDVDGDGWLDVVTAPTLTDSQAKHLSHPRVYMNLGELSGEWLGLEYQDARIPQMHPTAGPRFCSVAAGDLDGDKDADLYFGDYDSGGSQLFDYNNRVLINDGNGFFSDQTGSVLGDQYNYGGTVGFQGLGFSAFGAASVIADMNGDGTLDVVKQTSLTPPQHVAITHNNVANEGVFDADDYRIYDSNAPYFVSTGDLNNDGRLDMIVTDDGNDRYYLNTGNNSGGLANFSSFTLGSITGGFGGDSYVEDLNNDGFNDVVITDVDVDISGCSRTTRIFRNLGNLPNVTLQVQGQVIPDSQLTGVHNAAIFDLNGDGWKDIVMGRCSSTQVWINVPPIGLTFQYPEGLPAYVAAGETLEFTMEVVGIGDATPEPGSARMFLSENGGPFNEVPMVDEGDNLYTATLPAGECGDSLGFYFTAELDTGAEFSDPSNAPATFYSAVVADGLLVTFEDNMEDDTSAWTVESTNLTAGEWEAVDPNGTINGGDLAAPEDDATAGSQNVIAFVTENGPVGGAAGLADVDGGPTRLISPVFSIDGPDAVIGYERWMYTSGSDALVVDISNNGGASWVNVPSETTMSSGSEWEPRNFTVSDFIEPTDNMRVRFSVADQPNDSITEAGVDDFQVEVLVCDDAPCDITGDGVNDVGDLLALFAAWGACPGCPEDINGDDVVNVGDLLELFAAWGPCP